MKFSKGSENFIGTPNRLAKGFEPFRHQCLPHRKLEKQSSNFLGLLQKNHQYSPQQMEDLADASDR